jgi:hypothetical protein
VAAREETAGAGEGSGHDVGGHAGPTGRLTSRMRPSKGNGPSVDVTEGPSLLAPQARLELATR